MAKVLEPANTCSNPCLVKPIPTDATNSTSCVTAERLRLQEVAFDGRPMIKPAHIGGREGGTILVKPALQGWVVNAKHPLDVSWLWFPLWLLGPLCQEGLYDLIVVVHDNLCPLCQHSCWWREEGKRHKGEVNLSHIEPVPLCAWFDYSPPSQTSVRSLPYAPTTGTSLPRRVQGLVARGRMGTCETLTGPNGTLKFNAPTPWMSTCSRINATRIDSHSLHIFLASSWIYGFVTVYKAIVLAIAMMSQKIELLGDSQSPPCTYKMDFDNRRMVCGSRLAFRDVPVTNL